MTVLAAAERLTVFSFPEQADIDLIVAAVRAAQEYREAEDKFVQTYAAGDGVVADAAMDRLRKALDGVALHKDGAS